MVNSPQEGIKTNLNKESRPTWKFKKGKEVMRVEIEEEHESSEEDKKGVFGDGGKPKELLEIEATIGHAKMYWVVDSGLFANIISMYMAEVTSLPVVLLQEESFSVTGVNGALI